MSEITWAKDIVNRREQLAKLLIEERKARKIRQQELARRLHQHQSLISRIEGGGRRLDVCEFLDLAEAVGFDPSIALRKIQGATCNGGCSLDEALAVVKAAGYRVSKPKNHKHKDRAGPTLVARFSDGTVTRMSTHTSLEQLDWERGVRLAHAAYESRWRTHQRAHLLKQMGKYCTVNLVMPVPPAIVSAHFEQDGKVLARYPNSENAP